MYISINSLLYSFFTVEVVYNYYETLYCADFRLWKQFLSTHTSKVHTTETTSVTITDTIMATAVEVVEPAYNNSTIKHNFNTTEKNHS